MLAQDFETVCVQYFKGCHIRPLTSALESARLLFGHLPLKDGYVIVRGSQYSPQSGHCSCKCVR